MTISKTLAAIVGLIAFFAAMTAIYIEAMGHLYTVRSPPLSCTTGSVEGLFMPCHKIQEPSRG